MFFRGKNNENKNSAQRLKGDLCINDLIGTYVVLTDYYVDNVINENVKFIMDSCVCLRGNDI